jgi:hypothetical protein
VRLVRKNNAATVTFTAAAFLLMGCLIAACGVALGVEAATLKFGIAACLCIAGPLFLASLSGISLSKHKSFCATPESYETERDNLEPDTMSASGQGRDCTVAIRCTLLLVAGAVAGLPLPLLLPWWCQALITLAPAFALTFTFPRELRGLAIRLAGAGLLITMGTQFSIWASITGAIGGGVLLIYISRGAMRSLSTVEPDEAAQTSTP